MIDKNGMDKLGRPCKDLYFMNLCFEVATRSIDPNTKHGCVAVDSYGGIITTGYNGPPQDYDDDHFPLTRPEKYADMIHAEMNGIYLSSRQGKSIMGSTFYITGIPCRDCLKALIQVKVHKIIYGPLNSVMINSGEYYDSVSLLLRKQKIIIERFKYDKELYNFSSRAKKVMKGRDLVNMEFEWNTIKGL